MSRTNPLAYAYSVKEHLSKKSEVPAIIMYDGIQLPDEKPFITVKIMPGQNDFITKHRDAVLSVYRYEVGVYATSLWNRSELQQDVRLAFMYDKFPLLDMVGKDTGKTFMVDGSFTEVPLDNDDLTNETKNHRVFFDIVIQTT